MKKVIKTAALGMLALARGQGQINEVEVDFKGGLSVENDSLMASPPSDFFAGNSLMNASHSLASMNYPRPIAVHLGHNINKALKTVLNDYPVLSGSETKPDVNAEIIMVLAHSNLEGLLLLQDKDLKKYRIRPDDFAAMHYPNAKIICAFGCQIGFGAKERYRQNKLQDGQILMMFGGSKIVNEGSFHGHIMSLTKSRNLNFPHPIDITIVAKDLAGQTTISENIDHFSLESFMSEIAKGTSDTRIFNILASMIANRLDDIEKTFPKNPEIKRELGLIGFRNFLNIKDEGRQSEMLKDYFNSLLRSVIADEVRGEPITAEKSAMIKDAINSKYFDHKNVFPIEGSTYLHQAMNMGYYDIARHVLERGVDINAQSLTGLSALAEMVLKNNYDGVKFLLSHGADSRKADSDGATPLIEAVHQQNLRMVKLLVEWQEKLGETDVNQAKNNGGTPLFIAVSKNNLSMVEFLLDKGADAEQVLSNNGGTAFSWAVEEGKVEMCKLLIKSGEDVKREINGYPILLRLAYIVATKKNEALRPKFLEIIPLLLDAGADLELGNEKYVAAHKEIVADKEVFELIKNYQKPKPSVSVGDAQSVKNPDLGRGSEL